MSLPTTGQLNWGVPLNTYITNAVLAVANQALTAINTHTSASDPHGDRAYAAGLVSPITTGTNAANGYVKLNGSGKLTTSMLPSGAGLSNFYDAITNYGATGNGSTDDSTALQNALNDAATAGGGEVWVGDGTFACGTQLVIGANTWLHLSPGATIKRIIKAGGSAPSIMIANVNFSLGTATPATGNILISGGKWDAVGGSLTSACTPIWLGGAGFVAVEQTSINGVAANPHIELNGITNAVLRDLVFTGTALSGSSVVPAIRLNSTSTSTSPAGMASGAYNNAVCANILVQACVISLGGNSQASVGYFVNADLYQSPYTHQNVQVTSCSTPSYTDASSPAVNPTNFASYQTVGNSFGGSMAIDLVSSANGWNNLSLANGWGGSLRYRLLPSGNVQIDSLITSDNATSTTVGTLPSGFRPTGTRYIAIVNANGNLSSAGTPGLQITTAGSIIAMDVHAFSTPGDWFGNGIFPTN